MPAQTSEMDLVRVIGATTEKSAKTIPARHGCKRPVLETVATGADIDILKIRAVWHEHTAAVIARLAMGSCASRTPAGSSYGAYTAIHAHEPQRSASVMTARASTSILSCRRLAPTSGKPCPISLSLRACTPALFHGGRH